MIQTVLHRTRFLASAALLLGLSGAVHADGPGTTTGDLLKIPIGARAIGMGEAFTAMADDSSALHWNPAGLSRMQQKEASFMHSSLTEGIHYEHLAFTAPGDSYAVGANFSYLGYGDIAGYDNSGVATGNIDAYSYVANVGISHSFTPALSLGVSGGLIRQKLDQDAANTFAVNTGALYELPFHPLEANYRLGLALQNLGPGLKFVSERSPLPRRYKVGAAIENIKQWPLNFTTDVTLPNDNDAYVSLGSEYWFKEIIALRLGYAGSNDEGQGVRVGVGLKYMGFMFDYAYAGLGDFGATNRIGISMRFGEKVRQLNSAERAILKEAKRAEKNGAYVPAIVALNELLDKDPTNDHILRYMIKTYDKLHTDESAEALVKGAPVPSPEDAALAELVPEGDESAYAQNTLPASASDLYGFDPASNPGALPEASALDINLDIDTKAVSGTPKAPPSANAPALSPADIYGN